MSTSLTSDLERRKLVRLRVRPDLCISLQKYENKTHYVVKDPVGMKYYRFNDQEYFVVKHFDGKTTLEETQKDFERKFRPHRLTLEDLEAFSQQLLTAGLVQHETALAGKQLFEKRRKQRRMQTIATWSNILYIKLPLFDPDRLLSKMAKKLWWIFTWWFFAASVALMLSAALLVATHFDTFRSKLPYYYEFFQWNRMLYMWIALGIVKVIHEFGHGLSCKAFGGECHEMGALLLCLSPALYCNVSDAWTLPNKWKRIIISFAGIYVELVIAAIATWIWWNTPHRPVINNVSLCVMVLCSVSTFVFNANPLMRFDGYYILADWLEIPNLRDRANRMLKNLMSEYALGMEVPPEPYMEPMRQFLFVIFAVVSWVYRWVITFSILYVMNNWLKPYKLDVISTGLALFSLASMFGWPIYRLFKGLHKRGRLPDMKRLNATISGAILATVLIVFFFVPLPISRVRQTGLVQIDPASIRKVTVPEDATLKAIYVNNGQRVNTGQQLAVFTSRQLESKLAEQNSGYMAARMTEQALRDSSNRARNEDESRAADNELRQAQYMKQSHEVIRNHYQNQIDHIGEKRGLLAPSAGVVLGAPKPDDVGKEYLREDPTPFCSIGDPNKLIVLVPVSPHDYQVLNSDLREMKELAVTIWIPGRGTEYVPGRVVRLPESDAKDVPLPLAQSGGGPLAIRPGTDQQKLRMPQSQQYLVTVEITQPDDAVCPGTLVQAKIHCRWRTSAWWVWHTIASAFDLGLL